MARKRKDEAAQDDIEEVEETVEEAKDDSSSDTVEEAEESASSDTVEEAKDDSSSDTVEEAKDDSSSDTVEEAKDDSSSDTVEEAKDDPSLDTVEEAEDDSSSDTAEEAEDDSSLDTVEEAEDDSSSDTVEEAEESAPSDDEETQDIDEEAQDIIEEVEEDSSALLASFEADLEFLQDSNNMSFYQANKAYYEDRNYEGAIAEFQAAIEYEKSQPSDLPDVEELEDSEELADPKPPNDVLVKSMYWMAEAYLKLDQTDQAVETFGQLSGHYSLHYLAPAAERRLALLKLDEESDSA